MIGRWREGAHRHLSQAPDVMRILMKPRNGEPWTPEDRALLRRELRTVARWTPGLLLFLLPAGSLLLSVYAWILDRRRSRREPAPLSGSASRTDRAGEG